MYKVLNYALALFLFPSNIYSAESTSSSIIPWETHWIKALQYNQNEQANLAENEFNLSVKALEDNFDTHHPYVYLERGRFYFYQDRHEEALMDLNKALNSKHLTKKDRITALTSRMGVFHFLGNEENALKDYEEFRRIYDDFAVLEKVNDKIIIRNVPESKFFEEMVSKALVAYKLCEKEADIQKLDSVWIVNTHSPEK